MSPSQGFPRRNRAVMVFSIVLAITCGIYVVSVHPARDRVGRRATNMNDRERINYLELEVLKLTREFRHQLTYFLPIVHSPYQGKLFKKNLSVSGVSMDIGARKGRDLTLIGVHLERESNMYDIIKLVVAGLLSASKGSHKPLILDVGANHGLVSVFSALLGAHVEAVEMQEDLAQVVAWNAQANKVDVAVINAAASSSVGCVAYSGQQKNEGAVAHLSDTGVTVLSIPIDIIIRGREVDILKVDVEGADLIALSGAMGSFAKRIVNNCIVEFGPPQRWYEVTKSLLGEGIKVIGEIRRHGYEVRLIQSNAFPYVVKAGTFKVELIENTVEYVSLLNSQHDKILIDSMFQSELESYLWFVRK